LNTLSVANVQANGKRESEAELKQRGKRRGARRKKLRGDGLGNRSPQAAKGPARNMRKGSPGSSDENPPIPEKEGSVLTKGLRRKIVKSLAPWGGDSSRHSGKKREKVRSGAAECLAWRAGMLPVLERRFVQRLRGMPGVSRALGGLRLGA